MVRSVVMAAVRMIALDSYKQANLNIIWLIGGRYGLARKTSKIQRMPKKLAKRNLI
jgi:hypothetical protein